MGGGGLAEGTSAEGCKIAGIAKIARHRRDRKTKTYHGGTETRRTRSGDRVIGKAEICTQFEFD
jgi:hypothetical protein